MRKLLAVAVVGLVVWKFVLPLTTGQGGPDLAGRWRQVDGHDALDLFASGGAIVSDSADIGLAGVYEVHGSRLRIGLGPPGSRMRPGAMTIVDFDFTLDGDELTLTADGRTRRFRRRS